MNKLYVPIINKINSWKEYERNRPTCPYQGNEELYDTYRACNDLDCILTDGNLYADTIFSLWLPLRYTLTTFHTRAEIESITGECFSKQNTAFLEKLMQPDILEILLPSEDIRVKKLSRLFEIGQTRANVMILPNRSINSRRGCAPFYDYMPYFLSECFEGGRFSQYFVSDDMLRDWIHQENLYMFFAGEIRKENIRDLSCTEDLKFGIPGDNLEKMIDNYRDILESRSRFFEIEAAS